MVAALIFLILTVLAGTALLAEVAPALTEHRSLLVLVSGHILLAVSALAVLIVALVGSGTGLTWAAFAVLLGVVALGATALVRTLRPGALPREMRISTPVIVVHGGAAAITVVVVLIAALTR